MEKSYVRDTAVASMSGDVNAVDTCSPERIIAVGVSMTIDEYRLVAAVLQRADNEFREGSFVLNDDELDAMHEFLR